MITEREHHNIEPYPNEKYVIITDTMAALNTLDNRNIKDRTIIFECWKLLEKSMERRIKVMF